MGLSAYTGTENGTGSRLREVLIQPPSRTSAKSEGHVADQLAGSGEGCSHVRGPGVGEGGACLMRSSVMVAAFTTDSDD